MVKLTDLVQSAVLDFALRVPGFANPPMHELRTDRTYSSAPADLDAPKPSEPSDELVYEIFFARETNDSSPYVQHLQHLPPLTLPISPAEKYCRGEISLEEYFCAQQHFRSIAPGGGSSGGPGTGN